MLAEFQPLLERAGLADEGFTFHSLRHTCATTLAAKGVRFTAAYCQNPICVPSRVSLVSGRMPSQLNTFGNTAAITTPIVIGYLVKGSGGFASALVFVGANAIVAILSYLLVVGEIKRLELRPV